MNPFVPAIYYRSLGSVTASNGARVPAFAQAVPMNIQKQELSFKELQHVDGMNLQGIFCSVYLRGHAFAVTRDKKRGGDKFLIDGETWLLVEIMEQWDNWCRVILVLQVNP